MEKYTLKSEDYQDINILIDLGKSIKENVEKLIKLEIEGKKQNSEYKSTLECIKSTMFLENNVLSRIGTNPEKITSIISHLLFDPTHIMEVDKQLTVIANGSSKDLIIHRIALRLNENMVNANNKPNNLKGRNPIQSGNMITSSNQVKLNLAIKNDLVSTILVILNREIHNSNNSIEVINFLIKIKYYLAFVFKNLESELINNNFEAGSSVYWTSQNFVNCLGINKAYHLDSSINYSRDAILPSVTFILEQSSYELAKPENAAALKLHEVFIRGGILLSPPDLTTQIKEHFFKQFGIRKIVKQDAKSNQLLLSILDKIGQDRMLVQTITFALKRESN